MPLTVCLGTVTGSKLFRLFLLTEATRLQLRNGAGTEILDPQNRVGRAQVIPAIEFCQVD